MPFGLPVALVTLAQAASSAPAATTAASTAPASVPKPAPDGCRSTVPTTDTRTIVVCAQKPQGYRLDPDVMEARREARHQTRPQGREMMKDNPCATVGPMGCRGNAGIDLVNAAAVLGTMAAKLRRGENIGKMFETDPQPTEYQLYVEAKKRREAKEAEAAAKAKAAQAQPPRPEIPTRAPSP